MPRRYRDVVAKIRWASMINYAAQAIQHMTNAQMEYIAGKAPTADAEDSIREYYRKARQHDRSARALLERVVIAANDIV